MNEESEKVMDTNNYDPIQKDFIDEKGNEATMFIEPGNAYPLNMGKANYKLVKALRSPSTRNPRNNIFRSDIGFKSSGFAQVTILAVIAALAVLFVSYLIFGF